jgi:hypothetical protein
MILRIIFGRRLFIGCIGRRERSEHWAEAVRPKTAPQATGGGRANRARDGSEKAGVGVERWHGHSDVRVC